ncbi:MAG TPA: N-formylglutamate amidohydrolase [Acetobacteraceae bacterium]|nr:N-formylglutamate amidohydrolase [Acetobacteraceae bacterium]
MDLPSPSLEVAPPPFTITWPARQSVPMVVASPHSGRAYSPAFLAAARLDPLSLRRSEDSFVDELVGQAPAFGVPLLAATLPRAWCDVNREAWELDPGMFADALPPWVNTTSPRVHVGLGTIARVVSTGEQIYRDRLRFADAEARVRTCWQPYHDALTHLLTGTRHAHGACLLIDCHSMPAQSCDNRRGQPDFVLGDAYGTACSPRITRTLEHALTGAGYTVRRNDPYAGGYITRHYGRPREGLHVIQLEIARRLYMDESLIEKHAGFEPLRRDLSQILATLATLSRDLLDL